MNARKPPSALLSLALWHVQSTGRHAIRPVQDPTQLGRLHRPPFLGAPIHVLCTGPWPAKQPSAIGRTPNTSNMLRPTPADCASGRVYAKKGSESYYSAFQQATYLPPQNTSSPKRRAFSRVLSHPPIFSCSLQLATRGMAHGGRGKLTGRMKQKDMDTRSLLEDGPRIAMGLTYGACVMHVRSRAIAGVGLITLFPATLLVTSRIPNFTI
jgi:hypothetical protein